MADCYGCPYRWHDSDCEYCSARGDEIIDGASYKKETCSYYKEYMSSKGSSSYSSSSSESSIDPKKGGKCWSCKYCEDIGTPSGAGDYYRKCTKSGHEYLDTCKFYCSDYVWDGKYAENTSSSSSSSSSSYSSSSSSSSSSSGSGCGVGIIIVIIVAVLIGLGALFLPRITNGESRRPAEEQRVTAVVYNVNVALNMRDAASQDSNVIATVPKGEEVIIIEEGTDYHYVRYGEYEGYCAADCLEIQ